MKKLFLFASLGALLAIAPAFAADDHHDDHPGGTAPPAHADHGGSGHAGGGAGGHMGAPGGHMAGPAVVHAGPAGHMAGPTGPMSGPIAPANHGAMGDHHAHTQGAANHMQPAVNNAMAHGNAQSGMSHSAMGHNNMGNNAGRGGNFAALHRNFTAPRRFHAGSYHRPSGYYAHRWTYGQILPALFFGRDYWINDFDDYGLMDPPPGTVWVRYGDDALLIDEYTGEVIQVEYGVFY